MQFCSWLREKHSIPDVVNHLFTQALSQRLQKFCINPMYRSDKKVQVLSPSESFVSASHLFQALSTSTNAFAVPISPIENVDTTDDGDTKTTPVDIFVQNAYFGQKPQTIRKVQYTHIHACKYTHACVHMHMHKQTHSQTRTHTHACMRAHTHTHTYTHIYTHAHTHAHTHMSAT